MTQPIRVLHLVSTFEVKTDTLWLSRLMPRLPRHRVEPAIACMYAGGPMQRRFEDLGVAAHNLDAPRELSPAALGRAFRLIRSLRPAIVHTHLLRADLYGGLAARSAHLPVVLTTAYAIGDHRRARPRRLDPLLDQLCRRFATDALAVSEAVKRDLVQRAGWPPQRVHVVHTGTTFDDDPERTEKRTRLRAEWAIPPDAPLVLTVARLSYEKGIADLITAAQGVRTTRPDVRFVIVGDGPLRPELQEQIRQSNLGDTARLAGFRTDIDAALAAADLFVLPSHMEGMPNAILEAHAAGLPVIATDAGGSAEAVEHGVSGWLVPPRDPASLGRVIHRLIEDEPLRHRLAAQGRPWARARFDVNDVAHRYTALYERLLARHESHRWPAVMRSMDHDLAAHT